MIISYGELSLLVFCLVASGFYSGSEAILMSIGVDRAKQLIKESSKSKGKLLSFLIDNSNELLTTILVGNNIVNIFIASLMTTITSRYFKNDSVAIAVGISTLLILFFGEIIPKTFARKHAEKLSLPIIYLLRAQFYLFYPVVKMAVFFMKLMLGENAEIKGRTITNDDIEFMVSKAEQENTIDSKQVDLLNSILEFPRIKVKDIMVPRSKVKSINLNCGFFEILDLVNADTHSRYPVCNGELEKTIGFLHVKDLAFIRGEARKNFKIENIVKDSFFVYEHMKIQAVFDHMNRKKIHLALVKDENAIVVGVITLEDIIEEVFGEIQDEYDPELENAGKENERSLLEEGVVVEGTVSLRDLDGEYDVKIPLNDNYSTLNGFILDMLGNHFPEVGNNLFWEGYAFELIEVTHGEIKLVRISDVDGEKHIFSKKETKKENQQLSSRSNADEDSRFEMSSVSTKGILT